MLETFIEHTLPSSGDFSNPISLNDTVIGHIITGTPALTGNVTISIAGTPVANSTIVCKYEAVPTNLVHNISFFGLPAIPRDLRDKRFFIVLRYDGGSWNQFLFPDFNENNIVGYDKLRQLTAAGFLGASAAGDVIEISVATAMTILGALSKTLAQGNIFVGSAGSVATAVNAKTNTYMLIGDGTTLNSVQITGDIAVTNAGVVSIGALKITAGMIKTDAVTSDKIIAGAVTEAKVAHDGTDYQETGVLASKLMVDDAAGDQLRLLLDSNTNDLFEFNENDIITKVVFYTDLAAGVVCLVDIGGNADLIPGGADPTAFIEQADANVGASQYSSENTYEGNELKRGRYKCSSGWMTITSTVNISASAFRGGVVVTYLPAA